MIIYGRYLELKERLEEKKKKVEFEIPSVKQTTSDINSAELVTTDIEEGTSNTKKGKRMRKRKTKAESKESTKRSDAEDSGRDSGSERSKTETIKKSKKEKEKEMLDKCRSQAAPVKFIVATGDKTIEDTKKILWTQVVSKNKTPKIKELVTLKGGDLLITPADEKTKETIKSIAEEGFGITQTGNFAPKVIIYDVDRQIAPEDLSKRIAEQNPELELSELDTKRIVPRFRTGPKEDLTVHWVCEVHPEVFRKINNRRVYLSYSLCRITEYLNITICNKCQKFGHIAAKCKSLEDTGGYCAIAGHRSETCPNKDKNRKCANCGGPYTSRHAGCSYKVSRVRLMVRNTNYGGLTSQ
ncbi:hypothetical protein AGLY_002216 [Aphis glycines]|uniref:CCHC-type domain-containing protein n=1 Tax=Aphis glycines TaxID=307491 RepID=A0A6G0U5B0_APHGL|nr:hypothetical protein AGLY_002216 [Aphis glycines]